MASIVRTQHVRAGAAEVFAALTRFETMHRWFVGVRRVAAEGPLEAGAFRTVTLATGGGYREQITRFEPGRPALAPLWIRLRLPSWTADIDVEEQGADTRVVWRIDYLIGGGRLGRSATVS